MAEDSNGHADSGKTVHPKKQAFLAAYRETANICRAAEAAEIGRQTHYDWLEDDAEYKASFEEAKRDAAEFLEAEAVKRATEGVQRLKFHEGKPIMVPLLNDDGSIRYDEQGQVMMTPYVEHDYSDTLLIFLMKGAMPEKYRERQDVKMAGSMEHSGKVQVYLPENQRDRNGNGTHH